jgi:hypothetical protein
MHQYRIKGYILLEAKDKKDIRILRALFAGAMQSLVNFNLMKFKRKNKISYSFERIKNGKSTEWPYHKFMVSDKPIKERKIK